jgi:hypothetical protein
MNPIVSPTHALRKEAILYKTDGTSQPIKPQDGRKFGLAELQQMVGGYIEVIYLSEGRLMVLNEEGKLRGLPVNAKATAVALPFLGEGDFIVGDALVCDEGLFD